MNHTQKFVLALLLSLFFQHLAYSEEFKKHNFKIGYAKLHFSIESTELNGDLTPPCVTASAENTAAMAFTYDNFFNRNWSS